MTKPSEDFSTRLKDAKEWRNKAQPFIEEALSYCCPGREHDFSETGQIKTEHDTAVFISLGEELATDLAGDLVTYYTPSDATWSEYLVTVPIAEDDVDAVMSMVEEREETLRDFIQSSNYYDIAPAVFFEPAAHGTMAMWVQKSHIMQPMHCEVVPPNQLYTTPGHMGYLDRFREVNVKANTLKALFDGWDVDLSDQTIQQKMQKANTSVKVVWGFWLDWSDPANPLWRCEITVDGKRITPATPLTLGPMAGSCPLLVGRFNPQTGKPWGRGPGWKALPDLRVLNTVDEVVLSGMDQSLMTTLIYPDDGFIDFSEGIEAGRAYAGSPRFDRNSIYDLSRSVNVDQGWFTEERIEERIRRAFYQDGPRQRGDTPPTAAQWVDERRRVMQRVGKPSAPLWTEFILPFIQRAEYLAVQAGKLQDAITHNGSAISVQPISPLQKAQNQDKVMVTRSNLSMAFEVLQDQAGTVIDMVATMKNIVKASGDELTVVRDEQAPPMEGTPGAPPQAV